MRVNSALIGFFTDRLVVRSGAFCIMVAIIFLMSSFATHSGRDLKVKQVNIIIRDIGHRLLLQAGDSTSRVLPVKETKEGTFLLEFEKELVFSHDSLMLLSHGLLPITQFPSGYTVTVHECTTADIVWGFQFNNASPNILPCRGRHEPAGCYTIEFTFPDFYKDVDEAKPAINEPARERKSAKVDLPVPVDHSYKQIAEQLESAVKVDPQLSNSTFQEANTTMAPFDYPLVSLVGGILLLLGVTLLIARLGKRSTPLPLQNQTHVAVKDSAPELNALGNFSFDRNGQRLLLGKEVISLTDKECKILELLNASFGELIPRETLMQKVWINEGVITGRSLDMFVSKLRKKLSSDPDLRITNVHGKGYKLEVTELYESRKV